MPDHWSLFTCPVSVEKTKIILSKRPAVDGIIVSTSASGSVVLGSIVEKREECWLVRPVGSVGALCKPSVWVHIN